MSFAIKESFSLGFWYKELVFVYVNFELRIKGESQTNWADTNFHFLTRTILRTSERAA